MLPRLGRECLCGSFVDICCISLCLSTFSARHEKQGLVTSAVRRPKLRPGGLSTGVTAEPVVSKEICALPCVSPEPLI